MQKKINRTINVHKIIIEYGIFFGIIFLAIYFRFININVNPGYYSDEGTIVEIAQNLSKGKRQYLAITRSNLIAARMPLFPLLLAGLFKLFGTGINTLRIFTSSLGVITVGFLYLVTKYIFSNDRKYLALLSAFLLAIYPEAILFNRLGFSYNLLAPLVLLMIWSSAKYLKSNNLIWLILGGVSVGLGTMSDLMMFAFVPVVGLIALTRKWKHVYWSIFVSLLPFGIYSMYSLLFNRTPYIYDFKFTFFRLGSIPLLAQYPVIVLNYASLMMRDYWWSLAVIGLFLLPKSYSRMIVLLSFFIPLFFLGRTAPLAGAGFYYLIPLFPILSIGIGSLLEKGIPFVKDVGFRSLDYIFENIGWPENINKYRKFRNFLLVIGTSLIIFLVVLSPFVITTFLNFNNKTGIQKHKISPLLVNTQDARRAIKYVNQNLNQDDLVIASPALAWAIESNAADFQQSLAFLGKKTQHFPDDIPRSRFAFNASYLNAKFVILDPIWWNWAVPNMEEVEKMVDVVTQWELVYQSGDVSVYKNPIK